MTDPDMVKQAVEMQHKPCECCGRPWTTSALAHRFKVGRLTLHRAMEKYRTRYL